MELFKRSFTLYVESGMKEMTERDFDILRNEQDIFSLEDWDFDAKFYKFIVDHYLPGRKFHRFYLHLTHLIIVFASPVNPHCLVILDRNMICLFVSS